MTDFTKEHTMACGHEWIPGVSKCNARVGTAPKTLRLANGETHLVKNGKVFCGQPAVWYCTEKVHCHVRRCPKHNDPHDH